MKRIISVVLFFLLIPSALFAQYYYKTIPDSILQTITQDVVDSFVKANPSLGELGVLVVMENDFDRDKEYDLPVIQISTFSFSPRGPDDAYSINHKGIVIHHKQIVTREVEIEIAKAIDEFYQSKDKTISKEQRNINRLKFASYYALKLVKKLHPEYAQYKTPKFIQSTDSHVDENGIHIDVEDFGPFFLIEKLREMTEQYFNNSYGQVQEKGRNGRRGHLGLQIQEKSQGEGEESDDIGFMFFFFIIFVVIVLITSSTLD